MRCISPFFHKELGIQLGCGKCLACRINKRRKWTARMLMENESHNDAVFITLTYDDDQLPPDMSVSKPELQKFFKRLRKRTGKKLRYYACGEYGEERGRPHYHAIIWGLPYPSITTYEDIFYSWKKGFIDCKPVNVERIQYTAGYVCKKYTKHNELVGDRQKEFSLMSRRPALGSEFLTKLVDFAFTQSPYDVISVFKFGKKTFPLDRLMREKLRNLTMSEEHIRDVKNLTIEMLQDQVLDLVCDVLGDDARLKVDDLLRRGSLHWEEVNELSHLVGSAFYNSQEYQDACMTIRRNQRRLERKDL